MVNAATADPVPSKHTCTDEEFEDYAAFGVPIVQPEESDDSEDDVGGIFHGSDDGDLDDRDNHAWLEHKLMNDNTANSTMRVTHPAPRPSMIPRPALNRSARQPRNLSTQNSHPTLTPVHGTAAHASPRPTSTVEKGLPTPLTGGSSFTSSAAAFVPPSPGTPTPVQPNVRRTGRSRSPSRGERRGWRLRSPPRRIHFGSENDDDNANKNDNHEAEHDEDVQMEDANPYIDGEDQATSPFDAHVAPITTPEPADPYAAHLSNQLTELNLNERTLKRMHANYMTRISDMVHRVNLVERDGDAQRAELEGLRAQNETLKDRMCRLETRLAQLIQPPREVAVHTAVSSSSSRGSRRRVVRRVLGDE